MGNEALAFGIADSILRLLVLAFEAHKAGDKVKAEELLEEATRREALIAERRTRSLAKKKTK